MALTASTLRERSLFEYIAALAIAIIAAVVIAAVATQSSGGQGSVDLSNPATPGAKVYEYSPPVYVIYIVDSQEKAAGIEKSEQEMRMTYLQSYQQPSARMASVLVASTSEEGIQAEQMVNLTAQEMALTDTIIQVVDLRDD